METLLLVKSYRKGDINEWVYHFQVCLFCGHRVMNISDILFFQISGVQNSRVQNFHGLCIFLWTGVNGAENKNLSRALLSSLETWQNAGSVNKTCRTLSLSLSVCLSLRPFVSVLFSCSACCIRSFVKLVTWSDIHEQWSNYQEKMQSSTGDSKSFSLKASNAVVAVALHGTYITKAQWWCQAAKLLCT